MNSFNDMWVPDYCTEQWIIFVRLFSSIFLYNILYNLFVRRTFPGWMLVHCFSRR